MKNNKGFSLVELIVVIAIMAILAAVAIPTFATFITKANEAADISFMNDAEYAIELAHAVDGSKKLESITVNVAADGKTITNIVYVMGDGTDATTDDVTYTIEKGDDNDVSKVVDWAYQFKAVKTVNGNEKWSSIWTITVASK